MDPLAGLREHCGDEHCAKYKELLDACNERVSSRTKTEEKCHEEMIDFMHCVDHCVSTQYFLH